jgi:predicted RecB family nuclease
MARRRRNAREHLRSTLELLRVHHPDAPTPMNQEDTTSLMSAGCELILMPRLAKDDVGRRAASVHALVRVGRVGECFTYVPLLIRNHEVVEAASTRRTLEGSLEMIRPSDAKYHDGVGTRSTLPMTRTGLALAHATRVLGTLGHADPSARAGVVDRHGRLWWFELNGDGYRRFNLTTYDELYRERLEVLDAHDEWVTSGARFPTAPYWHRDCPTCPYSEHCETQLEELDDVSLVRFTTIDQQLLLKEHGVETRAQLSRLDPDRARQARHKTINPLEHLEREEFLGRTIDKLDDLIYRARVHERGTALRIVDAERMGCVRADVEVDVDMESYEDATYLWGAYVTLNRPINDLSSGYRSFAEWGELTREAEATIFSQFWTWLNELRRTCQEQDHTFAAYCFWAQAEDGAMNRAVSPPLEGGPTDIDLSAFRHTTPPQWIDLHEHAKRQIQTEGPLGLKQLARAAGFRWRDANPSGEASILWYEESTVGESSEALAARTRLLEYNEDDCRATAALRNWLCGPARELAHRDDPL